MKQINITSPQEKQVALFLKKNLLNAQTPPKRLTILKNIASLSDIRTNETLKLKIKAGLKKQLAASLVPKEFCRKCADKIMCINICLPLERHLRQLNEMTPRLDVLVSDPDRTAGFRSPLSLAEMETEVIRARTRHNIKMDLEGRDWLTVKGADLTSKQQLVLHLHFWQGKTVRNIAHTCGISHAAVGRLLSRAKIKLGDYLLRQKGQSRTENENQNS